jgi:uncharacterized coiled-coil protein SlyX
MTLEERMAKMEADYGKQSDLLEARQGRVLTEHGDWLASHDAAMKQHDEAMKKLDERIVGLVSGVWEFMRRENPPA